MITFVPMEYLSLDGYRVKRGHIGWEACVWRDHHWLTLAESCHTAEEAFGWCEQDQRDCLAQPAVDVGF